MSICITPDLRNRFPGLQAMMGYVDDLKVRESSSELKQFSEEIFSEVKGEYTLASLKDVPIFRAYRDFFWRVGT